MKENWFKIMAVLLLLGALGNWPYSYYQILRWFVFAVGGYSAYLSHSSRKETWAWIFVATAILFNPIAPFYFSKNTWQFIDIIGAIVFCISLFYKYEIKK